MREPPINICPLMAIADIGSTSAAPPVCLGSRCAWWDLGGNECAMASAAVALVEAAANLEALAVNSQTSGNLPGADPAKVL